MSEETPRRADKTVELKTERLLLRPFKLSDVEDVFEYADDAEFAKYFPTIPVPYVRRDAEEFLAGAVLAPWETQPIFAIELDSKIIGGISVKVDVRNETGELGYAIGRPYWGQGLVPEAGVAVVDWVFEEFALAKVHARADLRNVGSQRVMEKLGMTREGVLRSQSKRRGVRVDYVYYGLLREEWQEIKRGLA